MKLKDWLKQRWAAYTIATCSAVILYLFLSNIKIFLGWIGSLWGIFSTIIIGLIFAYLLNSVSNQFEKTIFKKVKREESRHACSVILTIGCVLMVLTLLVVTVVPSITGSITGIIDNYNNYYKNIQDMLNRINTNGKLQLLPELNIEWSVVSEYINEFIGTMFGNLKNTLSSLMEKIGDIGSSVVNVIIGFIIAIYFLFAKENLKKAFYRFRSAIREEEKIQKENQFWSRCNDIFIQYITCSVLDAVIIGVANALFMLLFNMENITLISLIVGITNLMPTFGPIIGGVLGAIFLLLTEPAHAAYFVIFTIILQALDGYVIKPKLFSNSMGISPVLTLVSIVVGGKMFGVWGILLASPVVAVAVMLYEEKFIPFLQEQKAARLKKISAENPTEEEQSALDKPES